MHQTDVKVKFCALAKNLECSVKQLIVGLILV